MTFQPHIYRIFNPDIKNLPLYQLKSHWFTIGAFENRICSVETFMQKYPEFDLVLFRKRNTSMKTADIADCMYQYSLEKANAFVQEVISSEANDFSMKSDNNEEEKNNKKEVADNIELEPDNNKEVADNIVSEIDFSPIKDYLNSGNKEEFQKISINDYIKKWKDIHISENVIGIYLNPMNDYFQADLFAEVFSYFDSIEDYVIYFFGIDKKQLNFIEKQLFPLVKKNIQYNLIENFFEENTKMFDLSNLSNIFFLLCNYIVIDPSTIEHTDWNDSVSKQIFIPQTSLSPLNNCMFMNKNITFLTGNYKCNISNKFKLENSIIDRLTIENSFPNIVYIQKYKINKSNNIFSIISILNQIGINVEGLFIYDNLDKKNIIPDSLLDSFNIHWIEQNDFENFIKNNDKKCFYLIADEIHFQTPFVLKSILEYFNSNKIFEEKIFEFKQKKDSKKKKSEKINVQTTIEKIYMENQYLTILENSIPEFIFTDCINVILKNLNHSGTETIDLNPIIYPFENDFIIYPKQDVDEYESDEDWFKRNFLVEVINLCHRKDRLSSFTDECKKIGIQEFNVYNAIRPSVEQAFNCSFMDLNQCWECKRRDIQYFIGACGCKMSHYNVLKKFLNESDKEYLLLCEDDAYFEDSTIKRIYQSIMSLEDVDNEWDILYIGTHLLHKENAEYVNEFLLRVNHGLTTTAQIFHRRKISKVLEKIEQSKKEIDNTYSDLLDKKYSVYPMSVCQKKFKSDIVHHMCDYGDYHKKFEYNC